jgi:hypothetical protein
MNITEKKLKNFITRASALRHTDNSLDYVDPKGKQHIMDFIYISKCRLKISLFFHNLFGYVVKDVDETQLQKMLTHKNLALTMSLRKRFPNEKMRIIKIQKYNRANQLLKFRFIILIESEYNYYGLEALIL